MMDRVHVAANKRSNVTQLSPALDFVLYRWRRYFFTNGLFQVNNIPVKKNPRSTSRQTKHKQMDRYKPGEQREI